MAQSDTAIGAGLGAAIGSVIPGIGTVIGGAIGAIGGFFAGMFGSGYDVVQSQLPPSPYYQNTLAYRKSFDTQAEHDSYVASVWAEYKKFGPNGPVGSTPQDTVKAAVALGGLLRNIPRSSPPLAAPRQYPGGSPRGNGSVGQLGPQPTPPNTHYPGGTKLRKKRVSRRAKSHAASSHL